MSALSRLFRELLDDSGPLCYRRLDCAITTSFSVPCRRQICQSVVGELNSATVPALKQKAHISWILEAIGSVLSLPIEVEKDITLMNDVVGVMEGYLGVGPSDNLPEWDCSADDKQHFWRIMIEQLSLAFEPRGFEGSERLFPQYVNLCERILFAFERIAIQSQLTEKSWSRLLRVILGITDELLSSPTQAPLAAALSPVPERQVFIVWIASLMRASRFPELWKVFALFARRWFHAEAFVQQWSCLLLTLSKEVFSWMWDHLQRNWSHHGGDGSITLKVAWSGGLTVSSFALTPKHILYLFERMRRFTHPVYSFTSPESHVVAVTTFSQMVDILLQAVEFRSVEDVPADLVCAAPDVPDILALLGSALFDAALEDRKEFFQGRALALGALGRIFCTCGVLKGNGVSVPPVHRVRFCLALKTALEDGSYALVSSIILHCRSLFGAGMLPGLRRLIPSFCPHLIQFCNAGLPSRASFHIDSAHPLEESVMEGMVLRQAAVEIVMGFAPLLQLFSEIFSKNSEQLQDGECVTRALSSIVDGREELYRALADALCREQVDDNIDRLLWASAVCAACDPICAKQMTQAVMLTISERMKHVSSTVRDIDLPFLSTGLLVLQFWSRVPDFFSRVETPLIQGAVESMCVAAESQMDLIRSSSAPLPKADQFVGSALLTVQYCLIAVPSALWKSALAREVFETAALGADLLHMHRPKAAGADRCTRVAAAALMHTLYRGLGRESVRIRSLIPSLFAVTSQDSLVSEEHVEGWWKLHHSSPITTVRYLLEADTLLTFMELRSDGECSASTKPVVVVIVRDALGRGAFLFYREPAPAAPEEDSVEEHTEGKRASKMPLPPDILKGLFEELGEGLPREEDEEKAVPLEEDPCMLSSPPVRFSGNVGSVDGVRKLFTQSGMLPIAGIAGMRRVRDSDAVRERVRQIDAASTLEHFNIGLYRVGSDQKQTSPLFERFLGSVGWQCSIKEHAGYLGGISKESLLADAESEEPSILYHRQCDAELLFVVPSASPWNCLKSKCLPHCAVAVVLNESSARFVPNSVYWNQFYGSESRLPTGLVRILIVLDVCYPGPTYHVRKWDVGRDSGGGTLLTSGGPLQTGYVVSGKNLGMLVRETSLSAMRQLRGQDGMGRASAVRRRLIDSIETEDASPPPVVSELLKL